jgi:hypothetical protein
VRLQLLSDPEAVNGTVALPLPSGTCLLTGYRARPASTNPASASTGQYNVLLGQTNAASGARASRGGYAVLQLNPSGNLRFNGLLGDGTPWAGSGPISARGYFPVYTTLAGGHGSIFGWLVVTSGEAGDVQGELFWTQPGRFTNQVSLLGSRQQPPEGGRPGLDFDRALLIRESGSFSAPLTNSVLVEAGLQFMLPEPNIDEVTLTLKASTGVLAGRFRNPNGGVVSMKGVLLRKQRVGGGVFTGNNATGAFFLFPEAGAP